MSEEDLDLAGIIQRSTHSFWGNKYYARGRDTVDFVILVPINPISNLLERNPTPKFTEALEAAQCSTLFYGVDYTGLMLKQLLEDAEMREFFIVFKQRVLMPRRYIRRQTWIAEIIMPMLIFTVLGHRVRGVTLKPLSLGAKLSLPVDLFNNKWSDVRDQVLYYVRHLDQHPEHLFCDHCSSVCEQVNSPWHMDLRNFKFTEYKPPSTYCFLDDYNYFENLNWNNSCPLMYKLSAIRAEEMENKINSIVELLNKNAEECARINWYSYLVIVFDGHDMEHLPDDPAELLRRPSVQKLVYTGMCHKQEFRASHFRKGRLHDRLTGTSRMYLLRSEPFHTKEEAAADEAFVIDVLKQYLYEHRHDPEFLYLNKNSGPDKLLPTENLDRQEWEDFVQTNIPIFTTLHDENTVFYDGRFTGNFLISNERKIHMGNGGYRQRRFEEVEQLWKEFERKVHT